MAKSLDNLSRAVSHALRHEPWLYELELDEQGWADADALLEALRNESVDWQSLSRTDLAEMIRTSSKQRHEIVNGHIRENSPGSPPHHRLNYFTERHLKPCRESEKTGCCRWDANTFTCPLIGIQLLL